MVGFQIECSSCNLVIGQKVNPSSTGSWNMRISYPSGMSVTAVMPGFERACHPPSPVVRTGKLYGQAFFNLHWLLEI